MGIRVRIPNHFRIIPKPNDLFLFPFQEDFTQHHSWEKKAPLEYGRELNRFTKTTKGVKVRGLKLHSSVLVLVYAVQVIQIFLHILPGYAVEV